MLNFTLELNNPSIIYEQEKIALLKEKVALAGDIMDKKIFSSDWIGDKIFQMSEDQLNQERDLIVEDVKRLFRYNQIENEGNDPAISGESYGTPHDLASVYSKNDEEPPEGVPDGYDETKPKEMGRPKEKSSIFKTDKSAFGRDPLGSKDMKPESPFDKTRKDKTSAFQLENSLKGLESKRKKKIVLFEGKEEESSLLDESNILNEDI